MYTYVIVCACLVPVEVPGFSARASAPNHRAVSPAPSELWLNSLNKPTASAQRAVNS